MKGPRRLVRRGADQHMERGTEKKANAQEPPRSRDLAIAYGRDRRREHYKLDQACGEATNSTISR
jgi:hypothetical protein